jgi:hypothetical protein
VRSGTRPAYGFYLQAAIIKLGRSVERGELPEFCLSGD